MHFLNGEIQCANPEPLIYESESETLNQHNDNCKQETDINEENQDEVTADENLSDEHNFEHTMKKIFLEFLLLLHQEPNLSKKVIQKIFCTVKTNILDPLMTSLNASTEICDKLNSSYKSLSSFYKFQKQLKYYHSIQPQKVIVSQKNELVYKRGTPKLQTITETVSSISMSAQIASFLSLPGIFNAIQHNIHEIEKSSDVQNFIQGKTWRGVLKNFKKDEIVLPLLLYYDEFEPDNPLSANAGNNKVCGFYFTIPVIPQYLLSSSDYIFVTQICLSRIKDEDLDLCLEPIVHELKLMENDGIVLNICGEEIKVFIVLGAVIGDNLALNEILGFQKSFNSNVFCRICFAPKNLTIKDFKEREDYIRTEENYEIQLVENDSKKSGIKCKSTLSTLKYFHVTRNLVADIMHDIYEGVARYDIAKILNYFIYEKKYFDLSSFNKLKNTFDYGQREIGNLSREFSEQHIKKGSIMISASEMKLFIEFSTMIIGHKVPETDQKWKLLKTLVDLCDNLMKSAYSYDDIKNIKQIIEKYLKLRVKCFDEDLKPKHHFLLHYHRIISACGPLRNMMLFAFEHKNKQVKAYSKVSYQRINLPWSLSYKVSMSFDKFIKNHQNGFPSVTTHEIIDESYKSANEINQKPYSHVLIENDCDLQNTKFVRKIVHKNTSLKIGNYIVKDSQIDGIDFCRISDFLIRNNDYYFILEKFHILKYSVHLMSYIVGESQNSYELYCVENLKYLPIDLHILNTGDKIFRIKHV
ncbi:hypothetical protein PVAND_003011 [Polypedilum vanderplanki]|uniref:Uncharacterized protein n=1 Tax=Polypedilum vanderplanki TaxID=319348 RepID=A0A9J6BTU9_POLVA|nr:hypothetical protein PVAND_003011 [Polypedilum vanderplanki]